MFRLGVAFWLGLLFAFSAAADSINSIVAIVNDEVITLSQVKRYARLIEASGGVETKPAAEAAALDELINRRLQLQRAAQINVFISDEALQRRLSEFAREFDLKSDADWRDFARRQFGVGSIAAMRARVREDMQIQSLFYRDVFVRTQVYEEEIEGFVRRNSVASLQTRYRLGHILLPLTEEGRAQAAQLRERLLWGEDHIALSQAFSVDEATKESGELGFLTVNQLPFVFADEAQNLEVGGVSQVVETSRGYHLLKLLAVDNGKAEKVTSYFLQHIFLPLDETALKDAVYAELQAGADFADLVRRYSVDSVSIPNDGALGWFGEEDVPAYFAEALATMTVGDASAPLESPFGFHILRLADKQTREVDMQLLRDQARRVLQERRALSQRPVWLERLRANAYIRIVDPDFIDGGL